MLLDLESLCKLAEYAKKDPALIPNHTSGGAVSIPKKIIELKAELQFLHDANIKYSMGDTEQEIKARETDMKKLDDALSVYEPGLVSEK